MKEQEVAKLTYLELAHVLEHSLNTFLVALHNQDIALAQAFTGGKHIERESALMRFFLNVNVDEIQTDEEFARLNNQMWYALKISGKVTKNKNGTYSFVNNG